MTERRFRITFHPDGILTSADMGQNLLDIARQAGIPIAASCGGNGTCGTCKVFIEGGEVNSSPPTMVSAEKFAAGIRQACQSRIVGDLVVSVPVESRLEPTTANCRPLATVEGHLATGWEYRPPVYKIYLELPEPTLVDNSSDLSRLHRTLEAIHIADADIDFPLIRKMAGILRNGNFKTTLTLSRNSSQPKVINIEPGDTTGRMYGLAFDIGTTGVRGQLLDLVRGDNLNQALDYNQQRCYGDDVISRIAYAGKPGGLQKLQQAVTSTMNKLITQMIQSSEVPENDLAYMVVAGNTTMIQLLYGLDPKYLRLAPYVPTASLLPEIPAHLLGLRLPEHVHIYSMPSVASYVGGDIVSGVIGTGIFQRPETVLYIDLGTNGEIVAGNAEWMVTASASAGPAFEGGGIRHGMLASPGAIENVIWDKETFEPRLTVVGAGKPRGICGGGLIAAVAGLLEQGIIDPKGKFNTSLDSRRIRHGSDGFEFVLAWAVESETGKDIVLTEIDIDNLIRAKAAMFAGYQTMLKSVGLKFADLDQVIVAGTFGNHLDVDKAIAIGLLPELEAAKFVFVGNGSLLGARLSSFSTELIEEGQRIARLMTNIELSENTDFMNNYVAAMFLPHTDTGLFPSATKISPGETP